MKTQEAFHGRKYERRQTLPAVQQIRARAICQIPRRLATQLSPITCSGHLVIEHHSEFYEAGSEIKFLFFPTTAVVSMLYVLESGRSTEVALVGREGVVGVPLFLGHEISTTRAVVQSAGGLLSVES